MAAPPLAPQNDRNGHGPAWRERAARYWRTPAFAAAEFALYLLLSSSHIVPVSVTLALLPLIGLSCRIGGRDWRYIGLTRDRHSLRLAGLGCGLGLLYYLLETFGINPALVWFTGQPVQLEAFDDLKGNTALLLVLLALAWSLAAFGEEIVARGYLINRIAGLFSRPRRGAAVAILASAALFSVQHGYQGVTGLASAFVFAVVLGLLFVRLDRNLWPLVYLHGSYDTAGLLELYLDLHP